VIQLNAGAEIFLFSKSSKRALRFTEPPIQWVLRALSSENGESRWTVYLTWYQGQKYASAVNSHNVILNIENKQLPTNDFLIRLVKVNLVKELRKTLDKTVSGERGSRQGSKSERPFIERQQSFKYVKFLGSVVETMKGRTEGRRIYS
jgi:hypothetical protein